jgi:hypothetical protein
MNFLEETETDLKDINKTWKDVDYITCVGYKYISKNYNIPIDKFIKISKKLTGSINYGDHGEYLKIVFKDNTWLERVYTDNDTPYWLHIKKPVRGEKAKVKDLYNLITGH